MKEAKNERKIQRNQPSTSCWYPAMNVPQVIFATCSCTLNARITHRIKQFSGSDGHQKPSNQLCVSVRTLQAFQTPTPADPEDNAETPAFKCPCGSGFCTAVSCSLHRSLSVAWLHHGKTKMEPIRKNLNLKLSRP